MSSPPRRQRSTIVPGRKLAYELALADAGLADNSYDNYSTRSDRSVDSGVDEDIDLDERTLQDEKEHEQMMEEPDIDEEEDTPEVGEVEEGGDQGIVEIDDQSDESDLQPPPAKQRKSNGGLLLLKLPIQKFPNSPTRRYPIRNRCAPVRWWLGEEPVYKWREGCGELIGVTDVYIYDKQFIKYKTASPEVCMEQFMMERKRKRIGRKRKLT